jgi:SSS family solute:Na+ symporter
MFMAMLMRRVPQWSGWATVLFGMGLAFFFFNFMPTEQARGMFQPLLGDTVYRYTITNKFVITNLVVVPVCMLFFWATKFFYRERPGTSYERDSEEFFRRMNTPVDFEKEVGHDNTADQARVLGKIALVYGAFIVVLVLIPNTYADRIAILCCALVPLGTGFGLLRYARSKS